MVSLMTFAPAVKGFARAVSFRRVLFSRRWARPPRPSRPCSPGRGWEPSPSWLRSHAQAPGGGISGRGRCLVMGRFGVAGL